MRDKTRVFISHSHVDNEFALNLAEQIEETGLSCWIDLWELQVGDSLRKKIEEGIISADWLIIILSQNSIKSNWVQQELDMGLIKELESKDVFILPVLKEPCEIPLSLKTKIYADFTADYNYGFDSILSRLTNLSPEEKRKKRQFKKYCYTCDEQIPLFTSCFEAALSAGLPVLTSLEILEKKIPMPFSELISIMIKEYCKENDLEGAVSQIVKLVPTKKMELLSLYITVGVETGALGETIRLKFDYFESGDLIR